MTSVRIKLDCVIYPNQPLSDPITIVHIILLVHIHLAVSCNCTIQFLYHHKTHQMPDKMKYKYCFYWNNYAGNTGLRIFPYIEAFRFAPLKL